MPPKQTSRPPPAPQTVECVPIDEFGSGPTAKWREKGASDGSTSAASSRSRNPYGQAIVFVVGPGNYLEYQSLRQSVQTMPAATGIAGATRKITYGCTEILTPTEFIGQLGALGSA